MKIKTIISTLLISSLLLTSTSVSFADSSNEFVWSELENPAYSQTCNLECLNDNFIVERTIYDDYSKSTVKSVDGELLATAVSSNGQIVVTDCSNNLEYTAVIDATELLELTNDIGLNSFASEAVTNSVNYGDWTSVTKTVHIPTLTTAAFLSAVSVLCPYVSISVLSSVAAVFIAGGYSYATVKVRKRYGTTSLYQYSQEEVTIWGRHTKSGTKTKLYGPEIWTQKKSINS